MYYHDRRKWNKPSGRRSNSSKHASSSPELPPNMPLAPDSRAAHRLLMTAYHRTEFHRLYIFRTRQQGIALHYHNTDKVSYLLDGTLYPRNNFHASKQSQIAEFAHDPSLRLEVRLEVWIFARRLVFEVIFPDGKTFRYTFRPKGNASIFNGDAVANADVEIAIDPDPEDED